MQTGKDLLKNDLKIQLENLLYTNCTISSIKLSVRFYFMETGRTAISHDFEIPDKVSLVLDNVNFLQLQSHFNSINHVESPQSYFWGQFYHDNNSESAVKPFQFTFAVDYQNACCTDDFKKLKDVFPITVSHTCSN